MDYSFLLSSTNCTHWKRGLLMFNIELETNTLETLNHFPIYSKYLYNIIFGAESSSLFHAATTPNIIKYAKKHVTELSPETNFDILMFCIECLRHCRSNDLAFYLSLEVYDPSYYSDLVESLIETCSDSFYKLSIRDIVILIESNICANFLSANVSHIVTKMSDDPKYSADTFLTLLQANQYDKMVLPCLKLACKNNSPILDFLPTEVAYLFWIDKELSNLLRSRSKIKYPEFNMFFSSEKQIIKLCKSPFSVLFPEEHVEESKPSIRHRQGSVNAHTKEKKNKITDDSNKLTTMCNKNSPVMKVNTILLHNTKKVRLEMPSQSSIHFSAQNRIRTPSVITTSKVLHSWGVKKGGLGHSAWQKRFFDFYASSRSIIWKETPTNSNIKGLLILPEQAKIIPTFSSKNHQYRLIIEPEHGQKKYEIAFENEKVCNQWCQALQALCTEI